MKKGLVENDEISLNLVKAIIKNNLIIICFFKNAKKNKVLEYYSDGVFIVKDNKKIVFQGLKIKIAIEKYNSI